MSISEIAAVVVAVVSVATMVGPAAVKRLRKWAWQRDQNRRKWNALETTVEIEGSDEYFYQLGNRDRARLRRSRTAIRRESLLLLTETERSVRLTLRTEGEGTIVLQTRWRRRKISPGSTFELREGFREARIYMKKAKRVMELLAPDL